MSLSVNHLLFGFWDTFGHVESFVAGMAFRLSF